MSSNNLILFVTQDGSHSILNPSINEAYHSKYGAIQESQHVYINHGLLPCISSRQNIRIFEFGFGTGLNLFLTMHAVFERDLTIFYETLEKFPLLPEIYQLLNYPQLHSNTSIEEAFRLSHESPWGISIQLLQNVSFRKWNFDLEHFEYQETYDLVYFDAFAPVKQPEVWTATMIKLIYQMLKPNGILVTYCAKSSFKKTLKEVGFVVEKLKGPPHKMEMTRATKMI